MQLKLADMLAYKQACRQTDIGVASAGFIKFSLGVETSGIQWQSPGRVGAWGDKVPPEAEAF